MAFLLFMQLAVCRKLFSLFVLPQSLFPQIACELRKLLLLFFLPLLLAHELVRDRWESVSSFLLLLLL